MTRFCSQMSRFRPNFNFFSLSGKVEYGFRFGTALLVGLTFSWEVHGQEIDPDDFHVSTTQKLVQEYCISCHNPEKKKGKLDLESMLSEGIDQNLETWEDVVWMLEEREMPPEDDHDAKRPSPEEYDAAAATLRQSLAPLLAARDPHADISSSGNFIQQNCMSCHNAKDKKGNLELEGITLADPTADTELFEKILRRLDARQMPPPNKKRPPEAVYATVVGELVGKLDAYAAAQPQPGREETFRRLNRIEYQNAVRDLLAVEIDAAALLPKDDSSHGFDNITVGNLSPTLLDRYITAAKKVSRLAIGSPSSSPQGKVFRIPAELTQEKRIDGLPLGTRGGILIDYTFPQDGEYEIKVRLARDRNEHVEGLFGTYEMDMLLDRELLKRFTISRPEERHFNHSLIDQRLSLRTHVKAGPRQLGVAFLKQSYPVLEHKRMPHNSHFNFHRHPRLSPAVYQVSITGPYNGEVASDTPSRAKIFISYPQDSGEEMAAAENVLSRLMKLAYRRPISQRDLRRPMQFYRDGAKDGGFEAGIELALSSILVNPEFIFRIERDPKKIPANNIYEVSGLELASRLSFFIWSSIPDEQLLDLAIDGKLRQEKVLASQVRRMLSDPRSQSLVDAFASQWLYLRNLDSVTPDLRLYPDFDDNLRQAFRKETELFFESIVEEDRPVTDLLSADYTFLNERLARHYGIPHVIGSHFRRVELKPEYKRGGILRHGSILTVTSYATRTSPTIRGNWILENILGTPAPPAPPNVPALEENIIDESLPMRDRLAQHRADPACASCHDLIDPVGFVLESYDAVGRWREFEHGRPIDSEGGLPDGRVANSIEDLESGILDRPDLFTRTLTEKLLTFALGRGVEPFDAPAVRQIVREAAKDEYRFSGIITSIVQSDPFRMRVVDPSYLTAK